jgi:hypothetical protein
MEDLWFRISWERWSAGSTIQIAAKDLKTGKHYVSNHELSEYLQKKDIVEQIEKYEMTT